MLNFQFIDDDIIFITICMTFFYKKNVSIIMLQL